MKVTDFEFKKLLRETEQGKLYYSKLIKTGVYYDVLVIRKDKMIQSKSLKTQIEAQVEV